MSGWGGGETIYLPIGYNYLAINKNQQLLGCSYSMVLLHITMY